MRWTTTLSPLLLAVLLASPALAQEDRGEMKGHGEHMEMRMMSHSMSDMLAAHAEELELTEDQISRFEALDERLDAEKERHHAEMESIHEAAMEILTAEQRERVHAMMETMHEGDGMMGHREGPRKMNDDGDDMDDHEGHDMEDDGGA